MRASRRLRLAAAVAVLLAGVVATGRAEADPGGPPVVAGDFPDPAAIQVGDQYYAYATNVFPFGITVNVPVLRSSDLQQWAYVGDALPALGSWASGGFTWAPDVAAVGGGFVLYYTAAYGMTGRQCIGRATATAAAGPFTDPFGAPLVCDLGLGGSIDPSTFVGPDGQRYLLWKSEEDTLGGSSRIWSAPLAADGLTLAGPPTVLLAADTAWEDRTVEGPAMVRSAGGYVLLYGGNRFATADYAMGYATCATPSGPCAKQTVAGPWVSSAAGVVGPGGPSVLRLSSGALYLAFHGWINAVGYPSGSRAMYLEPLDLSGGVPWVDLLPRAGNRLLRASNTAGIAELVLTFGDRGDVPLACDVTGSGVDAPVVFRRGTWYLRDTSSSGVADHVLAFGDPGDVPVCGDWDGDGVDTPGVFRAGTWYLRDSNTSGVADHTFGFGDPGDAPLVGRWTGGATSVGVHRGDRLLLASTYGEPFADLALTYGVPGDTVVVGDWDGDGTDTPGVFRGGSWYLRASNTSGPADTTFTYGAPGDAPLTGDWDGNGTTTVGVAR